jgi:hypothetical protein
MAAQAQKEIAQQRQAHVNGNGQATGSPESARDPRHAYSRAPAQVGAAFNAFA